jgi:HEAT repeat protein
MKDLSHEDASVKEEAIRAIVLFPGPHAGDLITALLARCEDRRDTSVRVRAIMALTVLDVKKEEIPRIVKAMGTRLSLSEETQVVVRFYASVCLVRFGEASKDVVTALIKGAEDPGSFEIRRMCIRALEMCGYLANGQPDPRVTNALLNRCPHSIEPTAAVRLEAVIALGSMGPSPDPMLRNRAVKLVFDMTGDRDKSVSIWAIVSWMALDKPNEMGIAKIKSYLNAPEQRIRLHAVRALGVIGVRVKSVVPTLIELLHDKDPIIVVSACNTLAGLGEGGMSALKALTDLADQKDIDKTVKAIAEAAIKQIKGK